MGELSFLQLQLTVLDELQELMVPEDRELWRNPGSFLKNPALQLHVAVWHQLTHHRLVLYLRGEQDMNAFITSLGTE